jgi:acetylornithine deacetylase/succinyl-diaminopimelate desuccinylase-like protein
MLDKRGMHAQLWTVPGGAPVVFGEKLVPGAKKTILFYMHYDGQPVEPKGWAQPDPFTPVVRTDSLDHGGVIVNDPLHAAEIPPTWRIYARGAGDDKISAECLLVALDALGNNLKENVKMYIDGEEERGGPSMPPVIAEHAADLKSDILVVLDGPQNPSGRPTMYFGARGDATLSITVYTGKSSMHRGSYGNWFPDANMRMAQLLSSMADPNGKIVIKDFYRDVLPLSPQARAMIEAVPDYGKQLQATFGVGSVDGAASSLQEGANLPALSVHTLQGGEAGAVIAGKSTADISIRLVKENDQTTMTQRVIDHIKAQGYFVVTTDPDVPTLAAHPRVAKLTVRRRDPAQQSVAWRTEPGQPEAAFISNSIDQAFPGQLVKVRTLGGGVPANLFIDAYHVPAVGIALANFDENQHTDNENVRMGNIYDGILTLASVLSR